MKFQVHDVVQVADGVKGAAAKHAGRAGNVTAVKGGAVVVALDANAEQGAEEVQFTEASLVRLHRN